MGKKDNLDSLYDDYLKDLKAKEAKSKGAVKPVEAAEDAEDWGCIVAGIGLVLLLTLIGFVGMFFLQQYCGVWCNILAYVGGVISAILLLLAVVHFIKEDPATGISLALLLFAIVVVGVLTR